MSASTIPPYSREATVAAVRDYYALLTDMYLDPADVLSPPPPPSGGDRDGGWPSSTIDRLECMGKTTSVLDLLRHLPYIRGEEDDGPQAGVPGCHFADWRHLAQTTSGDNENGPDGHSLRECSEPVELVERDVIPPYVIGLTYGGRENPTFLLDTRRGIVHWYECPDGIRYNSPQAVTDVDDPFDWADTPEEEAEWRAEHPAWSVTYLFEILKKQLLELRYVPVGSPSRAVLYSDDDDAEEELAGLVAAVRAIYQRHGWPDRGSFDKEACLREVKRLVKEEYPDHDFLYDEDEDEEEEEDSEEDGEE
ncbi:hypothetical protein QBC37DRAFT_426834 [Rhypophila decipiens]|uniref:Alpha beta hydrolase fold protein n=1 Tax=Rhypophila decipiens TaxID=261697 RepID=A0AAN6Y3H7_9PEZI|nr:hypothetical protein QBC37DRAFT_426834 [Rhypophila decipiens]